MLHNELVKCCEEVGQAGRNVGKCVQFNYQHETWEIFYQDANGKAIQRSRGLALVKKDIWGNQLSKDALEKDMICKRDNINQLEQAFGACPAANGQRLIVRELEGKGHSTLTYQYNSCSVDARTKEKIDVRKEVVSFLKQQI